MKGQRIGYVRVSSDDQNLARQLDGVQLDKTFADKASGGTTARPALDQMLAFVREGDTIIVHSMDRLARNLDDLRKLVQSLTSKGVQVQFIKEALTFTGEEGPMANLLLSVMGAFAEFERAIILERQREGIKIAKANGVYKGRKSALKPDQVLAIRARASDPACVRSELAREFGISRTTLYSTLKAD
ncbi:recombinase family protein [Massilia sp. P8910]|uniref:recombinase family protein n=1 Tax=Massilia antarctica TaxID=2765360 RepID=UPI001E311536|nr:recombinase family protein [Massilia antarctica]MCE3602745.1 recombinase family protein [Massilia antarctica]